MKHILIFIRCFFISIIVLFNINLSANVAQPGFWSAGGAGSFSLLYPEDSLSYKKVQMAKERVSVLLAPGFAVVKGQYWMLNTTADTVSLKAGYPLNSLYEGYYGSDRCELWFDSLYSLVVAVDGKQMELVAKPGDSIQSGGENKNWYVWDSYFSPMDTTLVEVYFLVNTNQTQILQGYNKDFANGFVYLLETGAVWKQPINEGEVRINLMAGVDPNSFKGILPAKNFKATQPLKYLQWQFNDLSPSSMDNVVVAYGKRVENFNFHEIVRNARYYFMQVDAFSKWNLKSEEFESFTSENPFEVGGFNWVKIIYFVVLFGLPAIGVVAVILIVFLIIRKIRKSKDKKSTT